MTLAFHDRRTVSAAPDVVWATLTDWSRADQWLSGVDGMRAEGPLAVGTVLRFAAQGAERTSTISALDAGRSITLSSTRPGVRADYRYTLEPAGDGTAVVLEADIVTTGVMRVLGPVIRRAIAKEDGRQLERLTALLA